MINSLVLAPAVTAVVGVAFGAVLYRKLEARAVKRGRPVPVQWQLQARPLFTDVEHTVWHWLKSAFYDHYVLVKIPVIRFLSPRSMAEGEYAHELLKGVYCSFTVCASDGTVIGCVDVPGPSGLKASKRDMKQKLFAGCGIAYAVVSAAGQTAATSPGEMVDMFAVAAARHRLKAKLEQSRKTRIANIESLSASLGIVDDLGEHNIEVQWDDSFIMGEEPVAGADGRR
ncbi:MAG: DUF2726 domain-containing protein [Pseudomonadota bacterium]